MRYLTPRQLKESEELHIKKMLNEGRDYDFIKSIYPNYSTHQITKIVSLQMVEFKQLKS